MASSIINFYEGEIGKHVVPFDPSKPETTTLNNFMSKWTDDDLEYHHDYIQHLFPLPERSPINQDAPIITKEVRDTFYAHQELRTNLWLAFVRMCDFYGFNVNSGRVTADWRPELKTIEPSTWRFNTDDGETVVPVQPGITPRMKESWLRPSDHNHLRISRIIRCLRILGMQEEAVLFYQALITADEAAGGVVSQTSKTFWQRAAEWELSKPPSYPREPEVDWLKEA